VKEGGGGARIHIGNVTWTCHGRLWVDDDGRFWCDIDEGMWLFGAIWTLIDVTGTGVHID